MRPSELAEKVGAALDRLLPASPSAHIGVAVSGGPDSVALLSTLGELMPTRGQRLTVLHVNHGLRPEADQERQLVETLCQQWQLPCIVEILTPPESRRGIEAWARAERYRFFRAMVERRGLDCVAVAHTRDDQAETVLFRLLRGSGRRGLAGIPPARAGWLIRPLLGCTRQEVLTYLAARQLPYVTDPSNADVRYTRNKIRHRLLPFLEHEFSPQVRLRLATLADTLRAEEEWLETLAAEACVRVQEAAQRLSLARLAAEPPALRPRILRQWLEQAGQTHDIGFAHLERVLALSEKRIHGRVELPGSLHVRVEGNRLVLEPKHTDLVAAPYCYVLIPGRELIIPQLGWRVMLSTPVWWQGSPEHARVVSPWVALFDATVLSSQVLVRTVHPGDRISPLGMRGHKKVHDIFIDTKVPAHLRRAFPLVVVGSNEKEIAWVPGCVRGEVATVTPATRQVCRIEVNPLPEKPELC